jgi:hypothetical protein
VRVPRSLHAWSTWQALVVAVVIGVYAKVGVGGGGYREGGEAAAGGGVVVEEVAWRGHVDGATC